MPRHRVDLTVIEAYDLKNVETLGKSSPRVEITLDAKHNIGRTQEVRKNLAPSFGDAFTFPVSDVQLQASELQLWFRSGKKDMGKAVISLPAIVNTAGFGQMIAQYAPVMFKGKKHGEVGFKIEIGAAEGASPSPTGSSASPPSSPRAIDPAFRARIVRFYEYYQPEKLGAIDELLRQYLARTSEEELIRLLVSKYGPEPSDDNEWLEETDEDDGGGDAGDDDAASALQKTTSSQPAAPTPHAEEPPPAEPPVETPQRQPSTAPTTGTDDGAASATGPPQPPSRQASVEPPAPDVDPLRAVTAYFTAHEPHKVPMAPDLLARYAGREHILIKSLSDRYGPLTQDMLDAVGTQSQSQSPPPPPPPHEEEEEDAAAHANVTATPAREPTSSPPPPPPETPERGASGRLVDPPPASPTSSAGSPQAAPEEALDGLGAGELRDIVLQQRAQLEQFVVVTEELKEENAHMVAILGDRAPPPRRQASASPPEAATNEAAAEALAAKERALAEHDAALAEREAVLGERESGVAQREDAAVAAHADIDARQGAVEASLAEMEARAAAAEQQQAALLHQEEALAAREAHLAQQEADATAALQAAGVESVAQLAGELDASRGRISELEAAVAQGAGVAEDEVHAAHAAKHAVLEELEGFKSRVAELTAELGAQEATVSDLRAQVDASAAGASQRQEEAQQQALVLENEVEALRAQLREAATPAADPTLEGRLAALEEENAGLKAELTFAARLQEEQVLSSEHRAAGAQQMLATLRAMLTQMYGGGLRCGFAGDADHDQKLEPLMESLTEDEHEVVSALREKVIELVDKERDERGRCRELSAQVGTLQADTSSKDSEIDHLAAMLAEARAETSRVQREAEAAIRTAHEEAAAERPSHDHAREERGRQDSERVAELELRLHELEGLHADAEARATAAEQDAARLAAAAGTTDDAAAAVQHAEEVSVGLRARVEELERQASDEAAEQAAVVQQLEAIIAEAQRQAGQKDAEIEALRGAVAEAGDGAEAAAAAAVASAALEERERAVAAREEEAAMQEEMLVSRARELDGKENARGGEAESAAAQEDELAQWQEVLRAKEADIHAQEQAVQDTLRSLEGRETRLTAEIEALKVEKEALQATNDDAQQDLRTEREQVEARLEKAETEEKFLKRFAEELNTKSEEAEAAMQEAVALRQQIEVEREALAQRAEVLDDKEVALSVKEEELRIEALEAEKQSIRLGTDAATVTAPSVASSPPRGGAVPARDGSTQTEESQPQPPTLYEMSAQTRCEAAAPLLPSPRHRMVSEIVGSDSPMDSPILAPRPVRCGTPVRDEQDIAALRHFEIQTAELKADRDTAMQRVLRLEEELDDAAQQTTGLTMRLHEAARNEAEAAQRVAAAEARVLEYEQREEGWLEQMRADLSELERLRKYEAEYARVEQMRTELEEAMEATRRKDVEMGKLQRRLRQREAGMGVSPPGTPQRLAEEALRLATLEGQLNRRQEELEALDSAAARLDVRERDLARREVLLTSSLSPRRAGSASPGGASSVGGGGSLGIGVEEAAILQKLQLDMRNKEKKLAETAIELGDTTALLQEREEQLAAAVKVLQQDMERHERDTAVRTREFELLEGRLRGRETELDKREALAEQCVREALKRSEELSEWDAQLREKEDAHARAVKDFDRTAEYQKEVIRREEELRLQGEELKALLFEVRARAGALESQEQRMAQREKDLEVRMKAHTAPRGARAAAGATRTPSPYRERDRDREFRLSHAAAAEVRDELRRKDLEKHVGRLALKDVAASQSKLAHSTTSARGLRSTTPGRVGGSRTHSPSLGGLSGAGTPRTTASKFATATAGSLRGTAAAPRPASGSVYAGSRVLKPKLPVVKSTAASRAAASSTAAATARGKKPAPAPQSTQVTLENAVMSLNVTLDSYADIMRD